jgi:hypothetical protein
MIARDRYRPQFEQLEQRAVPANLTLHLTGTHPLSGTVTGQFVPPAAVTLNISAGLLTGSATLTGGQIPQSGSLITFTDALGQITVNHGKFRGNVDTVNTWSRDLSAQTFNDNGTIIGGTKGFKGVTGSYTITGSVVGTEINANLTGTITGPGSTHGRHRHHP